ncbi:ABC transporter substrate-binding protein [Gordoniibacillus kamchatkensis]|uniref:ABC transporter substrate-binding protein n=1 Tax=Gordoniibacillus kamchatkensis TaxID=1590651 RepID=A0ABR5ABS4_9BACL|nr:ABC transporter substrate-binding protein [Paenibacillus sp. VKM B-2647]KIL38421.1 ABC transporter substrate-binding protein [Paenibacillus sp. VKM B-2647]
MKKWVPLLLLTTLVAGIAGCGGGTGGNKNVESAPAAPAPAAGKPAEISVLMGKPEISKQFDALVDKFNKSQNKVKVSVIPLAGQNAFQKMSALYSSGNAPTIIMMGKEFPTFKDKLLDLSGEPWVKHAAAGTLDFVKDGDKIKGMPVNVESFGFLYNKSVLDKAVGGSFDPKSIKTRDDLKALFDKVAKVPGVTAPITISPMDWSLGAHFTNIFFTNVSGNRDERHKFLDDMKAGTVNLQDNKLFSGWLDTFDLMKQYNADKKSPLSPQYDDAPLALASGKVGLWFMGNWSLPQIKEVDPKGDYGLLPVPVSNDPNDPANHKVSTGVPSYWVVDGSQSKPEQQEGAKQFLNWMVGSDEGQKDYVTSLGFIPVFDNIKTQPADYLNRAVLDYMKAGDTLEYMNSYYPPDGSANMGATMQKYLAGEIDRAVLTKAFTEYWKQVKK